MLSLVTEVCGVACSGFELGFPIWGLEGCFLQLSLCERQLITNPSHPANFQKLFLEALRAAASTHRQIHETRAVVVCSSVVPPFGVGLALAAWKAARTRKLLITFSTQHSPRKPQRLNPEPL